jgi:hypothetical protein
MEGTGFLEKLEDAIGNTYHIEQCEKRLGDRAPSASTKFIDRWFFLLGGSCWRCSLLASEFV